MRRTEWLPETRRIRFEEAYEGWTEKRLTQEEAAQLLGACLPQAGMPPHFSPLHQSIRGRWPGRADR